MDSGQDIFKTEGISDLIIQNVVFLNMVHGDAEDFL
jgi:hypothetical protein